VSRAGGGAGGLLGWLLAAALAAAVFFTVTHLSEVKALLASAEHVVGRVAGAEAEP